MTAYIILGALAAILSLAPFLASGAISNQEEGIDSDYS